MEAYEYPVHDIPQCLIEIDRWVAWKTIMRDGRPTKVPIDTQTCEFASVSEPKTWSPFDLAMEAFSNHHDWDGLGIVFTEVDSLAGVDLDDCLDERGQFTWGQDIVKGLNTYTEISPSGRGVKLFLRGVKPALVGSRRDGFGPLGIGKVEVYDQGRFFAVTGRIMEGFPRTIEDCHDDFNAMCDWLWPRKEVRAESVEPSQMNVNHSQTACLDALLAMNVTDHNDGSHRLFAACCRCVEHDLDDQGALGTIRNYEKSAPFPIHWSDTEILKRIRDAEKRCTRGFAKSGEQVWADPLPSPLPVADLVDQHPRLRTPIIDGLLREGETMNVIAPPKAGKSWLVTDLALSIATGRPWLGAFPTHQGNVLLLDNELHAETSADRIPRVAEARDVRISDTRQSLFIDNLRGRLLDFEKLRAYFDQLAIGFFKVSSWTLSIASFRRTPTRTATEI
ncbi:AAA family ATPase [Planctomycetes bacterium TBK1r]|uniref:DNA primase/polymerase bifunctional N-terminal domain-containing protein n=1 Tax=Stieleria magnilauensis TaxID=2527963 RepID=A0ABX5XUJ3_9BACT|nr:hypothetical protein TBK1r_47100 [Planctomycetes bacterium TBK1r]